MFTTKETELIVLLDNSTLTLKTGSGGLLTYYNASINDQLILVINHPRYKDYRIIFSTDQKSFRIVKGDINSSFTISGEHIELAKSEDSSPDLAVRLPHIETFGFKGYEEIGTGRGFIWSRSLPLLKNTILLGHGPDTFGLYFPQHDYIGKLLYLDSMREVVDKPHNYYLQIAIQTGVISLLSIIAMFMYYLISSFQLFRKTSLTNELSVLAVGIYTSFIGYIVSILFTDSIVSVAPVFWVLFAVGLSMNQRLLDALSSNH
jgi:hypothetical protein